MADVHLDGINLTTGMAQPLDVGDRLHNEDLNVILPDQSGALNKVLTSNGTDASWQTPTGGGVSDGDKGDITVSGSGTVWTIDAEAVTYSKMQHVANSNRVLGRITSLGEIEELTGANITTFLGVFTSLLQGVVPASGGGTTTYLRADGTWATVTATAPDIALTKHKPGTDQTITDGYTAYVGGYYEIETGTVTEIGVDSILEIG